MLDLVKNKKLVIVNNESLVMSLMILLIFVFHMISGAYINSTNNNDNFLITKINGDGEIERTIKWHDLCARETIVNWGNTSIALREVALNGGENLQLIYENNHLTECIESQTSEINICQLSKANINNNNLTINDNEIISIVNWIDKVSNVMKQCRKVEKNFIKNSSKKQIKQRKRSERSLQQMVIAPGTKWCGPHRTASSYKELGGLENVDRCCRRHDHCCRSIPPFSERYNFWNYMPFTLSHCGCDQRSSKKNRETLRINKKKRKRRELFMIPGTQWCGRGNRATKYTNLGGFRKADECCRRHDLACPFYIPAFQTRYGLFNWGISTLMHCTCDERFRTCLKMAGTSSANFIGRIFFNVVQTKCFVLKPQKNCIKYSWWGKCEKYEYKKQAHLRDNVPY